MSGLVPEQKGSRVTIEKIPAPFDADDLSLAVAYRNCPGHPRPCPECEALATRIAGVALRERA